ncbi:MAG TPA: ferritin-like domain-containing protein [Polyangiales bacterium]|nr:ferritin-like domain-containing protein [Polyangiales bacterium]
MPIPDARGSGGTTELDYDAGSGDDACPKRISAGVCDTSVFDEIRDGQCCYIRTSGTCCGRPFLDGERMLGAAPRVRADWLAGSVADARELDAEMRRALGRAWLEDARMEHASIASFAKLTLQLLALGAPAELIEAAQRAALDEMVHAQACFGLASRYYGEALGPAELPMPEKLLVPSLAEAAAAAVREGCVAETLAAAEAAEQLRNATDPQARAALSRIAADEARHAAIAYRFVRWALAQPDKTVSGAVREAFASARAQQTATQLGDDLVGDTTTWRAHGRLTQSEKQICARAAWRDIIEPCASALQDS